MRLLLPLLLLLTVSCTSLTSDIRVDARTYSDANLRAFHTWQWDSAALLLADTTGRWSGNGFDLARALQSAVETQLRNAGYTQVASGADVSVSLAAIGTREDVEAARAAGDESPETTIVTEGSLLVDVIQNGTNELLWRGVARSTTSTVYPPAQVRQRVDYAVQEMFAQFQR